MATYKVPQDVEADDKLLGPFSFRQFIYLIIVAAAVAIGWGLSQIFIGLAVVVLPIIIFFGALALPLRKDQPMETYLAAIVSFYIKPRKRLWDPDGRDQLIEITAPKVVEVQRTKDLSQSEAEQRLSYLADIVDSQGWAVRGVAGPVATPNSAMNPDMYFEAQQTEDVLDTTGRTASMINDQLAQTNARYRQDLINQMQQQAAQPQSQAQDVIQPQVMPPQQNIQAPDPYQALVPGLTPELQQQLAPPQFDTPQPIAPPQQPTAQQQLDESAIRLEMNPYPTMNQTMLQPLSEQTPAPQAAQPIQTAPEPSSADTVSPDIMNLANNTDLSIETISREAKRIEAKESLPSDEVVISLR